MQKGLSKPLQEMILSSGDEEQITNTSSYKNDSSGLALPVSSRYNRRNDSQADDIMDDDEDEEDDDDDEFDDGN